MTAGLVTLPNDWRPWAVVAGLLILAVLYAEDKAGEAAAAVMPTNPENVFNRAVLEAGRAVTGDTEWTGGGAVWELGHDIETDALTGKTYVKANPLGVFTDRIAGVDR